MRPSLKIVSAVVPAIASALVLPEAWASPGERAQISRGPNLNDPSHARFNVRCPGCLQDQGGLHDDLHLDFNIRALASSEPCGYGNITINELLLPQESTAFSSHGRGLLPAASLNRGVEHALDAEWEFSCLFPPSSFRDHEQHSYSDGARGQFFVLTIRGIDGRSLTGGKVGFTVSYNQSAQPQLFRVEPETYPVPDAHSTLEWLTLPSPDRPLDTPVSEQNRSPDPSSIDNEMRELQRLKTEAKHLRKAIKEQRRVVWRHFKAELEGLKTEIEQCEDMKCAFDVTLRKADWALRTIYGGFRPTEAYHGTSGHGEETERWRWLRDLLWKNQHSVKASYFSSCQPPSTNIDRAQTGFSPSDAACSAADKHDALTHNGTESTSHHERRPLTPSYRQGPQFLTLAFVIGHILAFAVFPISLVILVVRRCSRVRRGENRWTLESRRIIHRARRRKPFRKWWTNLWRDPRITDYEEKRALVVEQERILELAMQDEIRELQSAAEAVSSLVNGDDGRGSAPSVQSPYDRPQALGRRDSLPDYRSEASYGEPPPTYDDSNDDVLGGVVVDGFQYASQIGSNYTNDPGDWTPDSSVVGTSVRGDISSDEDAP